MFEYIKNMFNGDEQEYENDLKDFHIFKKIMMNHI